MSNLDPRIFDLIQKVSDLTQAIEELETDIRNLRSRCYELERKVNRQ